MSIVALSQDLECLKYFSNSEHRTQLTDEKSILLAISKYNRAIGSSKGGRVISKVILQCIQGNPIPMSDLTQRLETAYNICSSLSQTGCCHYNNTFFNGGEKGGYIETPKQENEEEEDEDEHISYIEPRQYREYFRTMLGELDTVYPMLLSEMVQAVMDKQSPGRVAHELE
jgi:hypothetical protein